MTFSTCVLCGNDKPFVSLHKWHSRLFQCPQCRFVGIQPLPAQPIERYSTDSSLVWEYYSRNSAVGFRNACEVLNLLALRRSTGSLLDVGCASGIFLEEAHARGFEVTGVEPNPRCVDHIRTKMDCSIIQGSIESAALPPGTFDIIHLGDVLEHFHNPLSVLIRLHDLIKADGVLIINTPNIQSPITRLFQVKPEEHLYYFSASTLRKMLKKCGFEMNSLYHFDPWRALGPLGFSSTFSKSFFGNILRLFMRTGKIERFCFRLRFQENLLAFCKPL